MPKGIGRPFSKGSTKKSREFGEFARKIAAFPTFSQRIVGLPQATERARTQKNKRRNRRS